MNCLSCNSQLVGRTDKKFCDAYCRNSYNNKVKRKDEQFIQSTNKKLRKNRRILKYLCPVGKATVRKDVLDAMRYDYAYFTSTYTTKKGNTYYRCYDYAFIPISDKGEKKALIVSTQAYMDGIDPWS
ncbi:MAG: hypothetical protein WBB45_07490 [Cyclobacteriaceae bacterium]